MEAEAQCAYLDEKGLVHGVITDDSDVMLFGCRRVLKNFFNKKEYVETYTREDAEAKLGLDREKMVDLALLLGMISHLLKGSDYTTGVAGIGPISALETIAEFDDLSTFKAWALSSRSIDDVSEEFAKKYEKRRARFKFPEVHRLPTNTV